MRLYQMWDKIIYGTVRQYHIWFILPRYKCKNPIDRKKTKCYNHLRCRGIAQFGSALGSGPRGRRFKSCCSDHLCGCSSMVERQPSKLVTRVRFPSPAPFFYPLSERIFYWQKISHGEQRKEEFWLSKLCIQVQTWMHSFYYRSELRRSGLQKLSGSQEERRVK